VELVGPTPGPPTELEAALALAGSAARHPVLRVGIAPLKAVLRAPPFSPLPAQPGELVAREAATLAGRGTLFVVAPTAVPISTLEAQRRQHVHSQAGEIGVFASFLGALPARFHPVSARTYRGFIPLTVYVYRG
jgi:hypothetical protein